MIFNYIIDYIYYKKHEILPHRHSSEHRKAHNKRYVLPYMTYDPM
jgi:hypothetical protein